MEEQATQIEESQFLARTGGRPLRRVVYTEEQLARRVAEMGAAITEHYPADANLLVLGLLKGSFIFMSDLVRHIDLPLQLDFLVASSYGSGTTSSGEVELLYNPTAPIRDRHLILIEDIVDSGNTINRLASRLEESRPASLELCALLHKHLAADLALEPRWVGFDAPSEFLVGYGLDHAEDFRHLPVVASI